MTHARQSPPGALCYNPRGGDDRDFCASQYALGARGRRGGRPAGHGLAAGGSTLAAGRLALDGASMICASLGMAECIKTKSVPLMNPSPTTPVALLTPVFLSPVLGTVSPTPVAVELATLVISISVRISPSVPVDEVIIVQSKMAKVPLTDLSNVTRVAVVLR